MSSGTRFQEEWVELSIKCCDGLVTVGDIPNLLCSCYLGNATSDKFIKKCEKNTQVSLLFSELKIITSQVDIFTCESFIVLTP